MKKTKLSRTLGIKSELIRVLSVDDLGRAHGGLEEVEGVDPGSSGCGRESWPSGLRSGVFCQRVER
jgi:hypothetical protein